MMKRASSVIRAGAIALCIALLTPIQGRAATVHRAPASAPSLTAVDFVDTQHGWVAGTSIFATSDGGRSWRRQYMGSATIDGFAFADRTHGWAWGAGNGGPSALLRTTDGGAHWLPIRASIAGRGTTTSQILHSLQFLTPQVGYAIAGVYRVYVPGSATTLVHTTDGGTTWHAIRTPLAVASACFADSAHGWVIAPQGDTVLRTGNGGRTWTRSLSAGSAFQYGGQIACAGPANVWALLYGGVGMNQESYALYHTADAGAHWRAVVASSTAGGGPAPGNTAGAARGAPGYGALLDAVDASTAYLVGGCPPCGGLGTTYLGSTHDGGHTWQITPAIPGIGFGAHDLSFPTAQQGWLVSNVPPTGPAGGERSVLLATRNGGRTWTEHHP